jgi:hypothetical protein
MTGEPLSAAQKALQLNLDRNWYGTIAEIGAGQEVARWFFAVGGAAGTVAKTISAYDMTVSDGMYGKSRRYVSRDRLEQMLDREYASLLESLTSTRGDATSFFVFGDTVATRSYSRREEGVGWLGIRFQHRPGAPASQISLHVRLLDPETTLQQEAVGLLGVNLIHAAWSRPSDLDSLVTSLGDQVPRDRVEVDFADVSGPAFASADARRLNIDLVLRRLARAVMFTADGRPVEPSLALYRRPVVVLRGTFRPVLRAHLDMLAAATDQLGHAEGGEDVLSLAEIATTDLPAPTDADAADLLARVDTLAAAGLPTLVSDVAEPFRLATYLRRYAAPRVVLVVGTQTFADLFRDKPFEALEGGVFEALGRLFRRWVRLALYPERDPRTGERLTASALPVQPEYRHLLRHLLDNQLINELRALPDESPPAVAADVLDDLQAGGTAWESAVPFAAVSLIKERHLFAYPGAAARDKSA